MSLARYTLIVLATVGVSLPLLLPTLERDARAAALFGGALAALNALLAFGLVSWSEKRSSTAFLRAVLGGMLARMALMLAAVVAAVLLLGLPKVPLAVSLLAYFVLFLALELGVVHRKTSGPAVGR